MRCKYITDMTILWCKEKKKKLKTTTTNLCKTYKYKSVSCNV